MITGGMEDYDFTTNRKRYIPNTLKEITVLSGTVLGYGLEGLESVEKVSVHGDNILRFAFRDCACLQELRILGEVEELNNTALMGCEALRVVYVESKSVRELVLAAIEKVGLANVEVVILE